MGESPRFFVTTLLPPIPPSGRGTNMAGCPSCGADTTLGATTCGACGAVLSRYGVTYRPSFATARVWAPPPGPRPPLSVPVHRSSRTRIVVILCVVGLLAATALIVWGVALRGPSSSSSYHDGYAVGITWGQQQFQSIITSADSAGSERTICTLARELGMKHGDDASEWQQGCLAGMNYEVTALNAGS